MYKINKESIIGVSPCNFLSKEVRKNKEHVEGWVGGMLESAFCMEDLVKKS